MENKKTDKKIGHKYRRPWVPEIFDNVVTGTGDFWQQ